MANAKRLPPSLPFHIEYQKAGQAPDMPARHNHEAFEIFYLVSGECNYFLRDRSCHVSAGGLVLIEEQMLHGTAAAAEASNEQFVLYFTRAFLQPETAAAADIDLYACFRQKGRVLQLTEEERYAVESLLSTLAGEYKQKQKGSTIYTRVLLTELLIFLNRQNRRLKAYDDCCISPAQQLISDITCYISSHYREKLSLQEIADRFYISPFHVSRSFKQFTGFHFNEFINCVRVTEAQRLLRETNLSITAVGEQVGYGSTTHFGRAFKVITGLSPLTYKKQYSRRPAR